MFESVLIANRGEIACRIVRAARKLGMRSIAVYSQADRDALHIGMADEAYPLGAAEATASYLNREGILEAAGRAGAACIHPGYGFLAEDARFAEMCGAAGVTFVGPPPAAMRLMGLKDAAKEAVARAGVPVLPGYAGDTADAGKLAGEAAAIGYPVMVKAVAGGGGTGLRRVNSSAELTAAIEAAQREGRAAFGEARVILEKCLPVARHIEVQVFADRHGNCVHLFERDCSLQRRHQKVIEEAPAPGMTDALRARMCEAAVSAARSAGYEGAGTVEFLVEGDSLSDDSRFYFLEMNTRLQVEHPVTEQITGLDLVEWQFRVAAGEPLPRPQQAIRRSGHAIEARLYAEDPSSGFLPSPGRLHALRFPEGNHVRIDTGVREGDTVSPYYDPMIAKIIARGPGRDEALANLRKALDETVVAGPRTNLAYLRALLDNPAAASGRVTTSLLGSLPDLAKRPAAPEAAIAAGVRLLLNRRRGRAGLGRGPSPWSRADGFVLGPPGPSTYTVEVDGERRDVSLDWPDADVRAGDGASGPEVAVAAGDRVFVISGLHQYEITWPEPAGLSGGDAGAGSGGGLRAPMHGRVAKVYVSRGDRVEKGARIAILEAMKMEHVLHAASAGVVESLGVTEGQQVAQGTLIASIAAENVT
ncbi:MAG: biotin carboxylase N-terminal domain-containing protein [Hyphomicrobiales bacterium]